MRIALFPGSFNPPHNGHLHVAGYMAERKGVDEVWLVVSPQNPFKNGAGLADAQVRLAMAEAAVRGRERIRISRVEFGLPRPSYTIATLNHLQKTLPEHTWLLIMGSDAWTTFSRWKDHERILEYGNIFVYRRRDGEAIALPPGVSVTGDVVVPVSSTEIRALVAAGKSVRHLVPAGVADIMEKEGLYRGGSS